MSDAPERVQLAMFAGLLQRTDGLGSMGYVRADLYEQQEEEIERLKAENDNLHWRAGTDSELTERIEQQAAEIERLKEKECPDWVFAKKAVKWFESEYIGQSAQMLWKLAIEETRKAEAQEADDD